MPSRRRTALLGTLLIGTLLLAAVALPASATSARGSDPTPAPSITLLGRGHGHGVGLSQDGALALGRAGASLTQVLGTFYPGTSLAPVGHADVRVAVASAKQHDAVRVLLAAGGVVRSGSSGVQVPPGGSVDLRHEADGYQVALVGAPAKAARSHSRSGSPYSITSAAPVQVVATGRVYRGTLQLVAVGPDLRVVDTVDVESYLLGLGEVRDPSWPLASLQAQVVAARTYALHARTAGNPVFDVWDDDRSQVYLGVGGEYDALARAVRTTRGEVLAFGGALINAFYSSSGGGVSATPEEGFGPGAAMSGASYLRAAPYPTADPQPWQVTLALTELGRMLRYPGAVTGLAVSSRGPSGRALTVLVSGSAGDRVLTGVDVQRRLGLRSTLFTVAGDAAGATGSGAAGAVGAVGAVGAAGAAGGGGVNGGAARAAGAVEGVGGEGVGGGGVGGGGVGAAGAVEGVGGGGVGGPGSVSGSGGSEPAAGGPFFAPRAEVAAPAAASTDVSPPDMAPLVGGAPVAGPLDAGLPGGAQAGGGLPPYPGGRTPTAAPGQQSSVGGPSSPPSPGVSDSSASDLAASDLAALGLPLAAPPLPASVRVFGPGERRIAPRMVLIGTLAWVVLALLPLIGSLEVRRRRRRQTAAA